MRVQTVQTDEVRREAYFLHRVRVRFRLRHAQLKHARQLAVVPVHRHRQRVSPF